MSLVFNFEEIAPRELRPEVYELEGIPRAAVEAHYKLYQGYVNKRNEILAKLAGVDLAVANQVYSEIRALKAAVIDGGVKRFGSGWTWLVWDGTGLAVYSTPNQDSPIMQSDVPLLGIDVWEHAYYLKYQNKRPAYLEAWWNVVNWDEVARRYAQARAS